MKLFTATHNNLVTVDNLISMKMMAKEIVIREQVMNRHSWWGGTVNPVIVWKMGMSSSIL